MEHIAHFHLPGLFEFYELYRIFLKVYAEHREYFYPWCDIGSIYGSPDDCLWGGGRTENGDTNPKDVLSLLDKYNISARLTFSNSLLAEEHLKDKKCNSLCKLFNNPNNGVIVHSDLLKDYLKKTYPDLYLVSSTTKVITEFDKFVDELNDPSFSYVVPDFRLNKCFDKLSTLSTIQKDKVEFLCNECCWVGCKDRKICYESVSHKNLGDDYPEHVCTASGGENGYRFSYAMQNPMFISVTDIKAKYIPMGFSNFKIEGRGLGSALVFEMLLYYMVKPEYQINVREAVYLDNMLDLF